MLSPEEEASLNVDALVNDPIYDTQDTHTPIDAHLYHSPRATPTIPPGFSLPAVPKNLSEGTPSRPLSRNAVGVIAPVVPVIPALGQAATPVKAKKRGQGSDHTGAESRIGKSPKLAPPAHTSGSDALTVHDNSKKAPGAAPPLQQKHNKEATSTPIKPTPKPPSSSKKDQSKVKIDLQKEAATANVSVATPPPSKRQPPGKLDIPAATRIQENEPPSASSSAKPESLSKSVRSVPVTAGGSVPPSPAAASTGSPIRKPIGPKTLRVVATPKTEVPPTLSSLTSTNVPLMHTVEKLRSRQASIASINVPGTPASELISDTASFTSTSISRANSPPPVGGKVGSAPVRKKTKSQAKKDRQERARQEEERAMEESVVEPEVVQAPIVGRKKKAKKPANNPKLPAVPPKATPATAKPVEMEDVEEETEAVPQLPAAAKKATVAKPPPSPILESVTDANATKETPDITAQSIIADLQKTSELLSSTLEFFKPLSSSLAHASRAPPATSGPIAPPDLKIHFSEADLEALAKKHPVRLSGTDGKFDSRTLITPQGKFFFGLTVELEEKALELERRIEEQKGAAHFYPRKQTLKTSGTGQSNLPALATALKEAGAKLAKSQGMPKMDSATADNTPPQPPQQPQQAPADAGAYLNQFVLPQTDNPPPNTPRQEMAAVGGLPGVGTANIPVNANKLAKAAKAVAEGGAIGTEFEGMGAMTADLLGGVFVQNLEELVGAGLGLPYGKTDAAYDAQGNFAGADIHGSPNSFEAGAGLGSFAGSGGRGRRSVLNVEEAEQAMLAAKKDHEAMEKKLSALMKRNRKILSTGKA